MEIIFRIDDFIIAKLEKFAHKFQLWTGKNNFWLARFFWGLFCAFSIIYYLIMAGAIMCLVALINVIDNIKKEKLILEKPDVLNYYKAQPVAKYCRVLFISFTITMEVGNWIMFLNNKEVIELIVSHNMLFFTLAVYFEALNPLPPGRNKIKELVKAMAKFFKESRVAVPIPEAAG